MKLGRHRAGRAGLLPDEAVRAARTLNSHVPVLVRAHGRAESDALRRDGASEIIQPELEAAGIVEEVGDGVSSLKPGDHVVLSFQPVCGTCYACTQGRPNLCETRPKALGVLMDGTTRLRKNGQEIYHFTYTASFAEETVVPESCAIKIRPDIPLDRACFVGCGVMTGVGAAIHTARVQPGSSVAVIGCLGFNFIRRVLAELRHIDPRGIIGYDRGKQPEHPLPYPWLRVKDDAELARRQFMLVRPEHRLVADSLEQQWNEKLARLAELERDEPSLAEEWHRRQDGRLPDGLAEPSFWEDLAVAIGDAPIATRQASKAVLRAATEAVPELVGGSADLAGSTGTDVGTTPATRHDHAGRRIDFGIRELAMGAVLNGIALHGGLRVFGSTFLAFSDYLRPALRLSAALSPRAGPT